MRWECLFYWKFYHYLKKLVDEILALCEYHDSALDWNNPHNGIIWTEKQIKEFNKKARELYKLAIKELGDEYEVEYLADEKYNFV